MLGEIVEDRYLVEAELGEGAMGRVYRARHIKVGRQVALKVMHRELAKTPAIVERFAREAMIAAAAPPEPGQRARRRHVPGSRTDDRARAGAGYEAVARDRGCAHTQPGDRARRRATGAALDEIERALR